MKEKNRTELAQEMAKKDGQSYNTLDQVMKNAYLHNADVEMARTGEGSESISAVKTTATGLLFQLRGKRTNTDIDELWQRVKKIAIAKMGFPFTVSMPCGRSVIFDDAEHIMGIGNENIKCSCGDPTHYMVKFEDKREEEKEPTQGAKVMGKAKPPRLPKPGTYLCSKCRSIHKENSALGKRHQKHREPIVKAEVVDDNSNSRTRQPDTTP